LYAAQAGSCTQNESTPKQIEFVYVLKVAVV
jgi:hypothetical protein